MSLSLSLYNMREKYQKEKRKKKRVVEKPQPSTCHPFFGRIIKDAAGWGGVGWDRGRQMRRRK
jgi:hypothetical protein